MSDIKIRHVWFRGESWISLSDLIGNTALLVSEGDDEAETWGPTLAGLRKLADEIEAIAKEGA